MNMPQMPDLELEQRLASRLLDVLILAGLILAMAMLCYRIFSPFLTLMVWALILAVDPVPPPPRLCRPNRRPARAGGDTARAGGCRADRGAHRRADELARRLGAAIRAGRSRQHPRDPRAAPRRRGLADRRQEDPRPVVDGARRSAGAGPEHAAEDRRPGEVGIGLRGQHRRRPAAVPRVLHHCRHHHGLRRGGRPRQPGHLRADRRDGAGRGIHQTLHGDHSRRRPGRHRRRLHPGASSSAWPCWSPACPGRAC